jgi:hypothetical protein
MPKSQTNYDRRQKNNNKSDYKLSPVVDPQVFHFVQVPLAAMKSQ